MRITSFIKTMQIKVNIHNIGGVNYIVKMLIKLTCVTCVLGNILRMNGENVCKELCDNSFIDMQFTGRVGFSKWTYSSLRKSFS